MKHKIAFTGSSGSGKTTLVKVVAEHLGIQHISGSAWDLKNAQDQSTLRDIHKFPGGGHPGVIAYSALNPEYGVYNQTLLLERRLELSQLDENFVTDRSPLDNLVYFLNQCAYHPMVTDSYVEAFMSKALKAYKNFSHIIYVKAVQPIDFPVENNHSRVANRYYQKSIDALFEYWLNEFFIKNAPHVPVLTIDQWDLTYRKNIVRNWLDGISAGPGSL